MKKVLSAIKYALGFALGWLLGKTLFGSWL